MKSIWHPLLKVKFGVYHDQISAAWIWHRIWRVADFPLFTHSWTRIVRALEHGTATLVDRLAAWMRTQPNIDVRLGVRVSPLAVTDGRVDDVRVGDETIPCDAVISTVALPTLARLVPGQTDQYFSNVAGVEYIGVVCMLLSLKHSFSPNFWTNINDPRISFNGVIEQTNLNHNLRAAGLNIIYIPFYLATTEPRYSASNEALFAEYIPMLKIINTAFTESWIKEWRHVFRAPCAQGRFSQRTSSSPACRITVLRSAVCSSRTRRSSILKIAPSAQPSLRDVKWRA